MNPINHQLNASIHQVMLLTKHVWPHATDSALRLRSMCQLLRRENWDVQVVTPRWHATWPTRVRIEEVTVHRLEHPPSNQLRQSLFRRSVLDWLDHFAGQLSWIWCDDAGLDSLAVCGHGQVIRNKIPVILRYNPVELAAMTSDVASWSPTQATVDACASASAVVVPNQTAQHQLLKLGLPSDRIIMASDWITPAIDRSTVRCRSARQAIAEINSDLTVRNQDRVVVIPSDMSKSWKLEFAIRAVVPLLDRYPHLRIWIHGDSPERERLYEYLQMQGHHRNVAMPGVFSCSDTLLQAADLCLFSAPGVGHSWLLPTCIASGIPVLVANSPDLSWHLGSTAASISFDGQSEESLRNRLEHWMVHPEEHSAAVRIAGQLVRRQSSNAVPCGGLAELFRLPVKNPTAVRSTRSLGNR